MILLVPTVFIAGLPYRPIERHEIQTPVWIPDDIDSQTRFFNEACRLHVQAWGYPSAAPIPSPARKEET